MTSHSMSEYTYHNCNYIYHGMYNFLYELKRDEDIFRFIITKNDITELVDITSEVTTMINDA